jgi:hypothetical protein
MAKLLFFALTMDLWMVFQGPPPEGDSDIESMSMAISVAKQRDKNRISAATAIQG